MASLPSVVVGNPLKTDSDFKKQLCTSIPLDQSNLSTIGQLNKPFEPISLDFREALSIINEGNKAKAQSAYIPLLQECIDRKSVPEAQSIHAHIIKSGKSEDVIVMTFLVNTYGKCGDMRSARRVFDGLLECNVFTWTSLITGYLRNEQPEHAVNVFFEMLNEGWYPTYLTLGVVLNACGSLSDLDLGMQVHAFSTKYGVDFYTSVGNALCSFYSKFGMLDSARKAFGKIKEKNVISWSAMVSACGDNGNSALGLALFVEMLYQGFMPNEYTLSSAASLCSVMQLLGVGLQVHSLSIKLGHGSSLPVINSIMYLYLKHGRISDANKLFDGIKNASLVTWNAMIAGHEQAMDIMPDSISAHHCGIEAFKIFLRLKRSGMKPDAFTFSSILTVCSTLVALEQGEQMHAQIIKSGSLSDVVVGTALVNMYNKCGNIDRAVKAFVEMSTRTMIAWTSMITAFAQHGQSKQALQLFEDMRFIGVRPNQVTFVGVLSACSHAGKVDEALTYFNMMRREYKIKPVMDHYACLIDMFVRLGRIEEAFEFVKQMDFEPNESIWSLLIAGCRSHLKPELGFHAAEQLLNHCPKDSETYVMLLNMYLSAGRWKDVSRVRKMMKDEKIEKLKDWSWISIREKIHSFKTKDQLHPRYKDVDKLLVELHERAKTVGYEIQANVEETDLETEEELEEEKEEESTSTVYHSEKLAVAFGLLNVPNAAPIRIVKSISMCKDCHSFTKCLSALTGRTIIIRDSKRLHEFAHGSCSCGDFGSLF